MFSYKDKIGRERNGRNIKLREVIGQKHHKKKKWLGED